MFSDKFEDIISGTESVGKADPISEKVLLSLLQKGVYGSGLELEEIIELMASTYDEKNRRLILDFSANYTRPHNQEILLLPPLYFSSICENSCLYCDFSFKGAHLSYEEFLKELDALLETGYRSIELVSGQDPELFIHADFFDMEDQKFNVEKAARYFELTKKRLNENGGGMLTSNIPPVDINSIEKLKSSGVDCYLSWLETFNPAQYSKLHSKDGPKAFQAFRLDCFEKAIEAGIDHVAGAFLKGLYDWRKEEVVLYCFDRYLKENTGHGFSIIGTPRLKGPFAESGLVRRYAVSDDDYELNIALDRILFDGILWLQTREPPAVNRQLIARYGGGIILTLDCSTAPGGYSGPPKAKAQFPVYRQKLSKAVSELEDGGYEVHFRWNSKTLSQFQREN